jgi:drug/metabolite transporter (DMT)-like permease
MVKKNQYRAYFFAILTLLCWSTVATAFKIALRQLNYIQVLLVANLAALLFFSFVVSIRGMWRVTFGLNWQQFMKAMVRGMLNPFAYYLILFKAYSILPAQVAQPANFVWPVVLMLLSVPLLKQPLRIRGLIALMVSFTGVLILSSQGKLGSFKIEQPAGVLLALSSSFIWALFWIVNLKDQSDDLVKLFTSSLFSFLYILVLSLLTHNLPQFRKPEIYAAVYAGFFEMGIPFILWLKALQYSESTDRVSNLIYLTPFISLILIKYVLHEQVYYTSLIGLCMIMAGIIICQIKNKRS